MSEKPILFNDEMVRAILYGRKTQTRRPVKRSTSDLGSGRWEDFEKPDAEVFESRSIASTPILKFHGEHECIHRVYPKWDKGDVLWVRECFRPWFPTAEDGQPVDGDWHARYRADGSEQRLDVGWDCECDSPEESGLHKEPEKWHPSIHMPRWASRTNLKVKRVWVERVQDITTDDVVAEGMLTFSRNPDDLIFPIRNFRRLWDSIYEKKGFGVDANPWVWCCEFEVVADEC